MVNRCNYYWSKEIPSKKTELTLVAIGLKEDGELM
jgi:hypothetical protein